MPRTTLENSKDIEELQAWQAQISVRMSKIDMILEQMTEQNKGFKLALEEFQKTVYSHNITMQKIEDRNDITLKVVSVVGGLLTTTFGVIIGQFIHLVHP